MSRVYMGHLSYRVTERDIERFFKGYGKVMDISLKHGYGFVEFEDYRDADDAIHDLNNKDLCGERCSLEHARGRPHGKDREFGGPGDRYGGDRFGGDRFGGDRFGGGGGGGFRDRGGPPRGRRPGFDKYGPPIRTEWRVKVENLSSRVSWQDLKDYVRQAGEVTYADAHRNKKNEGVIEFATREDMKKAVDKLDNTEINGRKIRMCEDRPGSNKKRSHSRSYSRSRTPRSRSRSGSRHSRDYSHSRSRSRSRSRSPVNGDDD